MKKFNLAALPLAVAGILASNAALAGTEACFEVYKGSDTLALGAGFSLNYGNASCIAEASRTGASATDLAITAETKIAYELTKNLAVDFDAIDAIDEDMVIVYVPTTDIPPGTVIRMKLAGGNAVFDGNANQIHLVQDTDGAGAGTALSAVASSDGAVDGEHTIRFITKAGVTITAGTRLALSRVSTGSTLDTDTTGIDPIGIKIANNVCTDPSVSQQVTLEVLSAVSDGGTGTVISGGKAAPQVIADISSQFRTFYGSSSVDGQVNAESTRNDGTAIVARTEFVYDATAGADKLTHNATQIISKAGFADYVAELDQAIILDTEDHLETDFIVSSMPGVSVKAGIYNGMTAATGVLDTPIAVETGTTLGDFVLATGVTQYDTEATTLFTPSVGTGDAEAAPATLGTITNYNDTWYVVQNNIIAPATTLGVMNFNYTHTPSYTLNFDSDETEAASNKLDHCLYTKEIHNIGVNGAVLKVPYTFDTDKNWVRITNEHDETAEITLDIFDESGNEKYSVAVGTVGEHASVVLFANTLIATAKANGYMGTGNRHTMTFTVTAPKDSVHGVSVQAIPGGVDRVMPVLDQNVWTQ